MRPDPGTRTSSLLHEAVLALASSDRTFIEELGHDGAVRARWTYRDILRAARSVSQRVEALVGHLEPAQRKIAIVCANSPEFVTTDLALLAFESGTAIPVPLAFSNEQAATLLRDACLCFVDRAGMARLQAWGSVLPEGCTVQLVDRSTFGSAERSPAEQAPCPPGRASDDWICKVVHTSGTTSRPKGVKIRAKGLDALLSSMRTMLRPDSFDRYLSLVPFSLLIEQVTAIYMVVLDGGTLCLLPDGVPLIGETPDAASGVFAFIAYARPTVLVVTPSIVEQFLVKANQLRTRDAASISEALFGRSNVPLVCCGGAPVSPDVLRALDELQIPICEGYGLSENSSVVSWNTRTFKKLGSVGKPLPHVAVKVADDGELLIKSDSLFAGYVGDTDPSCCLFDEEGWLRTGDLARIDADGFIHITGRKKSIIITAAGRNISPEWVEAQYLRVPSVTAVAVVGDGMTSLHGLFVVDQAVNVDRVRAEIAAFADAHLSQVERVDSVHILPTSDARYHQFFTLTGRPIRGAVRAEVMRRLTEASPS